jgi:oligoendopeptidase F
MLGRECKLCHGSAINFADSDFPQLSEGMTMARNSAATKPAPAKKAPAKTVAKTSPKKPAAKPAAKAAAKPLAPRKTGPQPLPAWDLSHFYSHMDAPELKADQARYHTLAHKFAKNYRGKLSGLDAKGLTKAIRDYEVLAELGGKLGSYAGLLFASDLQSPEIGRFKQTLEEQLTTDSGQLVFFSLELNNISDARMKSLLKEKSLAKYASYIRDVRAFKPYQLSEEVERVLLEKSVTKSAWIRLFDETMAAMRFQYNGKQLGSEEIIDKMASPKAEERKSAAESFSKGLKNNIKTFTLITNTLVKDKAVEDGLRGYARPISERNVSNFVEDEVVQALMEAVRASYPSLSHRYYKLKAKWLGKRQMDYWDRNAPLPGASEKRFRWDEAKDLVLSAYEDFSPELAAVGERFFEEDWIDAQVRPSKYPGAFSHPTVPSVHPYILLHYQGKTRDVMTLAHELGHGIHQVLAARQGALLADTPLTLAETASVFGEQLAFRALLKREKNAAVRRHMIAAKVEDMLNTVVRQIAFCDFEARLHDARAQGELTPDAIGSIWMKVQQESLGPAFRFHEDYKAYWSYIPHFVHTPFYVYAYAFGDCLVNSLYAVYQRESEKGKAAEFAKKYSTMLEAGGTLRHRELLKPFGLNASKPDFWQIGLDVIAGFIDELEAA